jgi:peptide-methionine (S)-S-oxide reductase
MERSHPTDVATLGGGCFWCLDAVYRRLRGVTGVVSGYAGGTTRKPTYEAVCGGNTGHAEVVQVTFDPAVVSYREILEVFFGTHDPTTLNRQGGDVGTQYRSVIFYHSPEQREAAEAMIAELERDQVFDRPVVTELAPLPEFHAGEAYHQDYFARNPGQGYCQAVIAPKVSKFRRRFADKLTA